MLRHSSGKLKYPMVEWKVCWYRRQVPSKHLYKWWKLLDSEYNFLMFIITLTSKVSTACVVGSRKKKMVQLVLHEIFVEKNADFVEFWIYITMSFNDLWLKYKNNITMMLNFISIILLKIEYLIIYSIPFW